MMFSASFMLTFSWISLNENFCCATYNERKMEQNKVYSYTLRSIQLVIDFYFIWWLLKESLCDLFEATQAFQQ